MDFYLIFIYLDELSSVVEDDNDGTYKVVFDEPQAEGEYLSTLPLPPPPHSFIQFLLPLFEHFEVYSSHWISRRKW
jgi:hypothetical protein